MTQQLAKNLFLSNERSIERKIKEAFLALWLEFHLSKKDILKLYLDRAYMGGGSFGAAAAAEFYFGKSVKDVNLAEAAMLAGLFKAPTKYAPHDNLPAARARAADVLSNLVDAGFMTEGQVYAARRNPATPVDRKQEISPDYYLDWAFAEMKRLADDGKLGNDRVLTVRTALDVRIQKQAEDSLESILRQYGDRLRREPGRHGGDGARRRGSRNGRRPGLRCEPVQPRHRRAAPAGLVFQAVRLHGGVADRQVQARHHRHGCARSASAIGARTTTRAPIPARCRLPLRWRSRSIRSRFASPSPSATASPKAGRVKIIETCRLMGLNTPLVDTVSLPIGAAEVTVLDMTASYAVFANGGHRADPYAAVEVRNSHGDVIYRRDRDGPPKKVIIPERVIADMNSMLVKVVEEGTGRKAIIPGVKVGGKTGTTNAYRDAWFIGFTGNLVAARLVRQRRLLLDPQHDRRVPSRHGMAGDDGAGASKR